MSQTNPFLASSKFQSESSRALILLPDIYSFNPANLELLDELSEKLNLPGYAIDYFYKLTNQTNNIDYNQRDLAFKYMQQLSGEDFLAIFNQAVEAIQISNPNIQEYVVLGFCFGGRLAYISGLNLKVKQIISFYGSGSDQPGFYQGQSPVDALIQARKGDTSLKILSLYGQEDGSLPVEIIENIRTKIKFAGFNSFKSVVYPDAGHAFFAKGRESYSEEATKQAWQEMQKFLE